MLLMLQFGNKLYLCFGSAAMYTGKAFCILKCTGTEITIDHKMGVAQYSNNLRYNLNIVILQLSVQILYISIDSREPSKTTGVDQ